MRVILNAALVGGVCGVAGAALYLLWRAQRSSAADQASETTRQLERLADRMYEALNPRAEARTQS